MYEISSEMNYRSTRKMFCSAYSEAVAFYTSGSCPSQPDPPMLSEQFVKALTISWIKRPNDDEFTLQMEDEATVR